VNSSFDYWTGPLKRPLSVRRVDVTDEWALVNKTPSPNVEVRLTEIVPRGLRDGREYPAVLGLAVHGQLAGPYLRMEAALDVLQMLAGPPRQVAFFARTAVPAVTGAVREQSTIQQIFVAERRRLNPESDEFSVSRLFTIKRNLRIGRIGERHVVELRPEHRALLASKAKEVLHDPMQSLLLIFECTGAVDLALGSVSLGSNGQVENEAQALNEITLEDPHIAAQLTRLKGVEHWHLPMAMRAIPYRPRAAAAGEQASWNWLPDSRLTTDIVICVYNAIEETLNCLESIQRCTTVPHTVTIIDDKSNDLTREQLRRYVVGKPWVRLIENPKNLGYTRSANIGLSSSSAEWVVLLNSDTIVTPGWLEGLFDVVKARPNAVMIGPLSNAASWQSVPDLHDVRGGWSTNPLPEGYSPTDIGQLVTELSPKMFPEATLLNGFCTLMRRDVVEQMGYLDEVAFPMGYGEENDLCLRVRKAGYSLALADHVYVYHVKSASFGSARRAELSKRGTAQLHLKHPDVDMKATQAEMAELTSLIELRKKLRDRLSPATGRDLSAKPDGPWQAAASP
jgi:GT2 family glycosyltransferase